MTVTHLIIGPPRHGVARFGIDLVAALRRRGIDTPSTLIPAADELPPGVVGSGGVHLQFTDRLFGDTPREAADVAVRLIDSVHAHGGRATATLHDLPQPSDGEHFTSRRRAYRDIVCASDGIVVSSEHERHLLTNGGALPTPFEVIPLPIESDIVGPQPTSGEPTVGIFGYVYPGKGHAEVLAALDGLDPVASLLAVGEPSDGHADLIIELRSAAACSGRRFRMTGHVPDDQVLGALRAVTVPVAHHRHVSASGSLNSWISAGRRPLTASNRYTEELAHRNPGALHLYPDTDDGLRHALGAALADPESTWLAPGTACTPSRTDAAAQYACVLERWHR